MPLCSRVVGSATNANQLDMHGNASTINAVVVERAGCVADGALRGVADYSDRKKKSDRTNGLPAGKRSVRPVEGGATQHLCLADDEAERVLADHTDTNSTGGGWTRVVLSADMHALGSVCVIAQSSSAETAAVSKSSAYSHGLRRGLRVCRPLHGCFGCGHASGVRRPDLGSAWSLTLLLLPTLRNALRCWASLL